MSTPQSSLTVREAVVDFLRRSGMTAVFGNPGSTELPLFRDFPKDFRYITALQESLVVGMADGYAQATGRAAFVNLHSAAGVGHALGNLYTAYRNQTPLVITAGQQVRSMLGMEPFLFAEDAAQFPKPYVKWSVEPATAADVPAAIARARYIAEQAPCGPTFVSIPADDWEQPAEAVPQRTVSRSVRGDAALLAQLAAALATAARPVFVAGSGVSRDGAYAALTRLAEQQEAPVWTAPRTARAAFPESHRLFAGFLPNSRESVAACLAGYDLIVVFGAPVFTYHMAGSGPFIPAGATLFQLGDNPGQGAWAAVGTAIVTSLRPAIEELLASALPVAARSAGQGRGAAPVPEPVGSGHGSAHGSGNGSGEGVGVAWLMSRLAVLRPADSLLVEEAPSSRSLMQRHLPVDREDGFFTCASGGLGHGLPAAVGVALARPQQRTLALMGDGSSLYSIQALWTAAQWQVPLTVVIVRNGSYASLLEFASLFGLPAAEGIALPALDFVQLATGFGVPAQRVTRPEDLDAALLAAFAATGPALVEVIV